MSFKTVVRFIQYLSLLLVLRSYNYNYHRNPVYHLLENKLESPISFNPVNPNTPSKVAEN